jgi:psp operon transcriptional activator
MGAQERLRAVEYGEVTRIGASRPIRVDVRIVAATNEDLPRMAGQGKFRADLLDRLSFEVITLPPLRARAGDVACWPSILPAAWPANSAGSAGPVSPRACGAMERYSWPGNVRELRNVVERAVYRWDNQAEPVADITFDPFESPWKPTQSLRAAEPEGG